MVVQFLKIAQIAHFKKVLPVLEIQKLRARRSNPASRPSWMVFPFLTGGHLTSTPMIPWKGVPHRLTKQSFWFGRAFVFFEIR